jgi:predicted GNAT family acetyltransferase
MPHPLDHPIWNALTTRQKSFAQGSDLAWRYPVEVSPFAAIAERAPENFAALQHLIPDGGRVALFMVEPVIPPDDLEVLQATTLEQMLGTTIDLPRDGPELLPLGVADVPEMLALTELTKPGPFTVRTHELGDFLGIRVGGRLVAMAGERMKLAGLTEVTAVCTHPDHRGHGYGRTLLAAVSRRIQARGETPFLHVFTHNQSAIELYERSGFAIRKTLHLTVLGKR